MVLLFLAVFCLAFLAGYQIAPGIIAAGVVTVIVFAGVAINFYVLKVRPNWSEWVTKSLFILFFWPEVAINKFISWVKEWKKNKK